MSIPGQIYTDTSTNKRYRCTAGITISPSLMDRDVTVTSAWKRLQNSGETVIETPKTIVLEDENGNKVVAVLVDQEVDFTATPNDIREGMVAATDDGVTIGEKFIPSYLVSEGAKYIPPDSEFFLKLPDNDMYEYTKIQAVICPYNISVEDSLYCEKVVMEDALYNVLNMISVSTLSLDSVEKAIKFGITNLTELPYIIRYFTYKEVY